MPAQKRSREEKGKDRASDISSSSTFNNEREKIFIRFPASLLKKVAVPDVTTSTTIQSDNANTSVDLEDREPAQTSAPVPQQRIRLTINANTANRQERARASNAERQARYRSAHSEQVAAFQSAYRAEHTNEARQYRAEHANEARQYRENRRAQLENQVPEVNTLWREKVVQFEREIRSGPTIICFCCTNLYFKKSTTLISKDRLCEWGCDSDVIEQAFWAVDNNVLDRNLVVDVPSNQNESEFDETTLYKVCLTCKDTFRKSKKLPTIAAYNGLNFPEKVECVDTLTRLEERLVAPRHIFQSLWTHKGIHGQYRSKGAIINVPVTVDTTVSSFPRNYDDSDTVHVHLARKMEYTKNYMQGVVSPAKIWEAARYLQTTPLYIANDVQLADQDEWEQRNVADISTTNNNDDEVPADNNVNDDQNNIDVNNTATALEDRDSDEEDFGDEFDDRILEELTNWDAEGIYSVDDVEDEEEDNSNDHDQNDNNDSADVVADDDEDLVNPGVRETLVIDENQILRIAPAEGNTPLSILMDADCMFLAFIKVFYGQKLNTSTNVSKHAMFKSLIRSFDRRAATRPDLLLFMNSNILLNKLKSNINIIARKRTQNTENGAANLTAANVSDSDYVDNMLSEDQAYKVFSGIRSSSAYWKGQKKNVMAMIAQFGIPTLFVTLSAAESYWPELLCILKKVVDNDVISEIEAEQLSFTEKARLIQSDPVTCARYFDHRFRELKKTFMLPNDDGPFAGYKVREYYFRVEFQHRGSPHIHMLVWLEDAPLFEDKACDTIEEADLIHQTICDFVDKIITCQKNWDGSAHHQNESQCTEDSWKELLKSRQTHKHTHTCKRKRGNVEICRFNIPFPPMKETKILTPFLVDEVSDEQNKSYQIMYKKMNCYLKENCETLAESTMSFNDFLIAAGIPSYEAYIFALRSNLKLNKIYLKRAVNEIMTNNYNTKLLNMMRSNMDIQFILDPYACCSYVVDYINKADKGMSKALKEAYEKHKDDPTSKGKDLLRDLTNTYYNTSEISAQEACYNILGIRMCESSTGAIVIPTSVPEERVHILKSHEELSKLSPDSTDLFAHGVVEHYINRPDNLEGLNLAQFSAYYQYYKKNPSRNRRSDINEDEQNSDLVVDDLVDNDNPEENIAASNLTDESIVYLDTTSAGQIYSLKENDGYIKKRTKSLVIRYHKGNIDEDSSNYFRILLMLYAPWRNEQEDLLNVNTEEIFNLKRDYIMAAKKEFRSIDDETLDGYLFILDSGDGVLNDDDDNNNPESYRILRSEVANDFSRYTLDIDDSSEAGVNEIIDEDIGVSGSGSSSTNKKTYCEKITLPEKLNNQDFRNHLSKLNLNQRNYLNHVIHHVRTNRDRSITSATNSDLTFSPFYHFVTGGAGVGKSMLIKVLYEALNREFDRNRDRDTSTPTVLLTAPTGKAAFNINGQTVHSAFSLPVSQQKSSDDGLRELSREVSHSMSVGLKDLKLVVIDEISMVSDKMFSHIDQRLRYIFDLNLPFGGISVLCVGDFNQLPSVLAKNIYSRTARSLNLWHNFSVFRLTEIMRQRGDQSFAVCLNNMAVGNMNNDDLEIIKSCMLELNSDELQSTRSQTLVLPHLDLSRTTTAFENFHRDTTEEEVANNTTSVQASRGICLFKTNLEVDTANSTILLSMTDVDGAVSIAFDRVLGSRANQSAIDHLLNRADSASHSNLVNKGLLKNLLLRVGARYMVSINIDTSDGIVNGSTGYLRKIDYGRRQVAADDSNINDNDLSNGLSGEKKPMRLWIEFEEKRSAMNLRKSQERLRRNANITHDSWTMISPSSGIVASSKNESLQLSRKQFPVVPAEALTVHKSQGGTYDSVVVYDTGRKKMQRSSIYVATSRATKAAGLKLICKENKFIPPSSISADKQSDLYLEMRRQEDVLLIPHFSRLSTREDSNNNTQLISHNIEGLGPNFRQILCDKVYLSSDIILLNETWTNPNDRFDIPGFTMISTADKSTPTEKIGARCYISQSLLERFHPSQVISHNRVFRQGIHTVSVAIVALNLDLYCSIYISPQPTQQILHQSLSYIFNFPFVRIIIAGDFNIDFKTSSSNREFILNILNEHGLRSTLPESVHSTTRLGTIIDNIFTNRNFQSSGTYISYTSYHEPLWLLF